VVERCWGTRQLPHAADSTHGVSGGPWRSPRWVGVRVRAHRCEKVRVHLCAPLGVWVGGTRGCMQDSVGGVGFGGVCRYGGVRRRTWMLL